MFRQVVVLPLLLLTSCASDVANRYYAPAKYPPKDSYEDVELLDEAPPRKFEVIADFQSRNESVRSVRKKAAEVGADAVIITRLGGRYRESEQWADQQNDGDSYSHIVGTAIKFTDHPTTKPK